jgi:hypothetical protein
MIGDIIKGWENEDYSLYNSIDNIEPEFLGKYGEVISRAYLALLSYNQLPLSLSDWVTSPDDIPGNFISFLSKVTMKYSGKTFQREDQKRVVYSRHKKAQACYQVSRNEIARNPDWKLYTGLCLTYPEDDEYHLHAFCVREDGTIIEPTPIKRNRYSGFAITPDLIIPSEFPVEAGYVRQELTELQKLSRKHYQRKESL